jgi:hypothetical protein
VIVWGGRIVRPASLSDAYGSIALRWLGVSTLRALRATPDGASGATQSGATQSGARFFLRLFCGALI